jgi:ABC-2 type transport system permease protein
MATDTAPAIEVGAATVDASSTGRSGTLVRNVRTVQMVWSRELIRLRRMPSRIISGLAQPILFLVVMGTGLSSIIDERSAGGVDYKVFLFPGILAMSIITSALFSAVSIVWDREFGFLREMLVAPVSRTSLVLGKAIGGGTVSVVQGVILVALAPFVGVDLTVARVFGLLAALLLLAFALTSFGIVLSSRMERMESFQMVMALVMQPMIFLSGAVFPLQNLPQWLAVLTRVNPATYGVDLTRRLVLPESVPLTLNGWPVPLWLDAVIVVVLGCSMLALAVRLFSHSD